MSESRRAEIKVVCGWSEVEVVESMEGRWRWMDHLLEPVVLQDLPQTDKSLFTVRVVEK